jgi:hypothetical protein
LLKVTDLGEAKNKRRNYAELLKRSPFCIFCGGNVPAVTVDHIPAAVMFDGKQRPKGLEFSACNICNIGAKHADLVAAWVGRMLPDSKKEAHKEEVKELLRSIRSNIPGLLEEMKIGRGAEKLAMRRLPTEMDGGLLRIGPLVHKYMQVFSLKLGLALHKEVSGNILPETGGIAVRWFSNYEKFTGDFPDQLTNFLCPSKTLVAGKKHVSDQFQYAWEIAENKEFGIYFASFRMAFAVFAAVATDPRIIAPPAGEDGLKVYSPLDVKALIQAL